MTLHPNSEMTKGLQVEIGKNGLEVKRRIRMTLPSKSSSTILYTLHFTCLVHEMFTGVRQYFIFLPDDVFRHVLYTLPLS